MIHWLTLLPGRYTELGYKATNEGGADIEVDLKNRNLFVGRLAP